VWTDGSTRQQDVYSDSTGSTMIGVLQSQKDINGNVITFTTTRAGRLTSIN